MIFNMVPTGNQLRACSFKPPFKRNIASGFREEFLEALLSGSTIMGGTVRFGTVGVGFVISGLGWAPLEVLLIRGIVRTTVECASHHRYVALHCNIPHSAWVAIWRILNYTAFLLCRYVGRNEFGG